ncbi:CD63 antigen [Leptinotarsa decemlineata]|uniref:CD63 antigen n=1 Tax=Leptinotarsa decemlineata TaxID=7539 RepID=UPI003D30479F
MGCATGIVKYLVFLANLIFALAGLALVIVGIMIKLNVGEASSIFPKEFSLAPVLSIIIGAIVFITAFLGCCGAVKESTCMLTTYSIVLLTIFILQVAVGVYAFLQIKDKGKFEQTIHQSVETTFNNMYKNQESNETMQVAQRFLRCCGVNGPSDYSSISKPIPNSCCPNIHVECNTLNNNAYDVGCAQELVRQLERYSKIIGGVAIGIAVVEIVGAVFGLCLASSIKNSYRRHIYA